jgi:hypothetical protein
MHDPQPNRLGVTRDQLSYDIPPWPGGPFTAEQLRALGEKGLSGAPSAAGPDRYDISYMPSAQVGSALDQYIHQYNTLLHNTSRMPNSTPAELSARQIAIVRHAGWAQQQLVAIHPFMNGNGRLSRYIMYMTLRIYPEIEQLPEEQRTPVLPNTASDLWTPYETWAEQLYRLIYLQHGAT